MLLGTSAGSGGGHFMTQSVSTYCIASSPNPFTSLSFLPSPFLLLFSPSSSPFSLFLPFLPLPPLSPSSSPFSLFLLLLSLQLQEFPFYTLSSFPAGFVTGLSGIVCARSVKLLDDINEPETRDLWWNEIRTEIRSHCRSMSCNAVLGYTEATSIW